MNILIVSYFFYPCNRIASFRIDAFARYFREAGHTVTVVAEGKDDRTARWCGCEVHYVRDPFMPESYLYDCIRRKKRWTLRRIAGALFARITADMRFFWRIRARRKVEQLWKTHAFDTVLTTFSPLAPHKLAWELRAKGYDFFWIADMRDEMARSSFHFAHIRRRLAVWERRICRSADLVTTVSEPLLRDFRLSCGHDRLLEVRNGYDCPEVHDACFSPCFTMAYVGHFYGPITPDNWFRAFAELLSEGALPADSRIRIVGNSNKLDVPPSIAANVSLLDDVAHAEAIRLSLEADTLVLIHPTGRKGVYTGKIFDYLPTNKPILALCDPTDVIAGLLAETGAGFVVDNADIEGIKRAILRCYALWRNRETLPRDWEKIRQYTRRNQTRILLDHLAAIGKK